MEGKLTIMLSANNILNLTTHPKVVKAMVDATTTYGVLEAALFERLQEQWTFILMPSAP